jgi:hypothetical protein
LVRGPATSFRRQRADLPTKRALAAEAAIARGVPS